MNLDSKFIEEMNSEELRDFIKKEDYKHGLEEIKHFCGTGFALGLLGYTFFNAVGVFHNLDEGYFNEIRQSPFFNPILILPGSLIAYCGGRAFGGGLYRISNRVTSIFKTKE